MLKSKYKHHKSHFWHSLMLQLTMWHSWLAVKILQCLSHYFYCMRWLESGNWRLMFLSDCFFYISHRTCHFTRTTVIACFLFVVNIQVRYNLVDQFRNLTTCEIIIWYQLNDCMKNGQKYSLPPCRNFNLDWLRNCHSAAILITSSFILEFQYMRVFKDQAYCPQLRKSIPELKSWINSALGYLYLLWSKWTC